MTQPNRYPDWTPEQHIARAEEHLDACDDLNSRDRAYTIQSRTAKAQTHIALATYKRRQCE